MQRVQLFEFHDLAWFPELWRNMMTDLNRFFATQFKTFRPVVPKLKEAMAKLQCAKILDLCSGASGPLQLLQKQLEAGENYPVTILMSDKYPNLAAYRNIADSTHGKITFIESSVDATDVPVDLDGFRTMFASFHHFAPDFARRILQDAVIKKVGIGIFEYTERTFIWIIALLLTPLLFWLTAPFVLKPCTASKLFWTYIIPVPVLLVVWDGLISCLRTYSPEELRQLVGEIDNGEYEWDIGKVRSFGACRVTYLIGIPKINAGL